MVGVASGVERRVMSPVTIALAWDSGWYEPNFVSSGFLRHGHLAGCEMLVRRFLQLSFCYQISKCFVYIYVLFRRRIEACVSLHEQVPHSEASHYAWHPQALCTGTQGGDKLLVQDHKHGCGCRETARQFLRTAAERRTFVFPMTSAGTTTRWGGAQNPRCRTATCCDL